VGWGGGVQDRGHAGWEGIGRIEADRVSVSVSVSVLSVLSCLSVTPFLPSNAVF
jgi:hypothetical protein